MANKQSLGWVPDLPDHRDLLYSAPLLRLKSLPAQVDLRPQFNFKPYDQGRIGSCTANAIAAAIQFDRAKLGKSPDFTPSRLFIYYWERSLEHSIPSDSGAQIRDGMKVVSKRGAPPEAEWPYDDTPADEETQLFPSSSRAIKKPGESVLKDAGKYQVISYRRLTQTLSQLKACLAEGFPFIFGFTVYDSLWDASGNPRAHVPLPGVDDGIAGGHAVLAVGYDDGKHEFIIRNSWGTTAQDHGYFYLPYSYLTDTDLASDFWTVRSVEA
ncbi:MAG TPA: C1 family peptidase [Polyangiaceae bacterium]|nr:C1 family peptidase [Polyangiaceae bacterium]